MSEQRNSAEIEDVLSSIRRLVSEELRPENRPARAAKRAKKAAQPDKLILSPALRIDAVPAAPALEPLIATEQDRVRDAVVVDLSTRTVRKPVLSLVDVVAVEPVRETDAAASDALAAVMGTGPVAVPAAVIEDAEIIPDPTPEEAPYVDADVGELVAEAGPAPVGAESETPAMVAVPVNPGDAALRDLVRDVIREELQGLLGERITRNVRKLVRVEINRMLATKDLS